ncbi:MAG TPA: DAK2 domain-containing protein [Candidatus Limnocylindrales bacterium]
MARRSCDGRGVLDAFRAAVATLEVHVEEVNALNVYPVPDGDTGNNMLATVRAALAEADGAASDAVDRVAGAISFGALMGARGNSGVILSQIFRGMAEGLQGKRRVNGPDLAHALTVGSSTAYGAVLKPVEGTILTVIREAATAAVASAEHDGDLEAVLTAAVDAAERAVARTPSLLPVLREAGVVDAGGQGLYLILRGSLRYIVSAEPVGAARPDAAAAPRPSALVAHADAGFGYEAMFLLQPRAGNALDVDAIRRRLETMGDSVLVAGDSRAVKVHVHSERPDQVLAYGLEAGVLTRISVENLDDMARDVREGRATQFTSGSADPASADPAAGSGDRRGHGRTALGEPGAAHPAGRLLDVRPADDPAAVLGNGIGHDPVPGDGRVHLPLAVVAVASGEGLATVFRSFGVAGVVMGGQADNPSTGELLRAVDGLDADEVLLLPNNANVLLAARQVAAMAHRPVQVVPTRNAAEGFAALLALDPTRGAGANVEPMTGASRAIQTLQVTEAVRDAAVAGRKVKKGQTIVLDPDDGLLAADSDRDRAVIRALEALRPGFELVTIYYGEGADLADAEALSRRVADWRPRLEVEVVHGGQPHYRYLIAAE